MPNAVVPFIPLTFAGFVIFLMVDGNQRFTKLKKTDQSKAMAMRRTHALMMTLLVVFLLLLIGATVASFVDNYPELAKKMHIPVQAEIASE